jgi:soluble P-type ATPase
MIDIDIPGFGKVELKHVVLDYNGTLACDGKIQDEILQLFELLQEKLDIHILTADTFGLVRESLKDYTFRLHIISGSDEAGQKASYIENLGVANVICYGNGNNDVEMLKKARVGIAVIGEEGCHANAIMSADLVVNNINDGLKLLLNPLRIKAGIRF